MRQLFTCFLLFCSLLGTAQSIYYIRFPNDLLITDCGTQPILAPPQLYNPDGLNVTMDYTDVIFPVIPDGCYKIERTWLVKSPKYDAQLPCIVVPNPNPNPMVNAAANLVGPVVSASSNPNVIPPPWTATRVAVTPGAPIVDYSTEYDSTANCYSYKQIIKVWDTAAPVLLDCPVTETVFPDSTFNNPQLWNESYWQDPNTNSHDLTDAPVPLSVTASDACLGNSLHARYELFLDLDQDGSMETVVRSDSLPAAGQVNFNSFNSPNFSGGIPQDFDERAVTANLKYRFGLYSTPGPSGSDRTFHVGWNTAQNPDVWTMPQLPCGIHKIKWIIEDGCGNQSTCTYVFTILCISPGGYHTLRGKVVMDNISNCQVDPVEPALPNWIVQLDQLKPDGSVLSTEYGSIGPDSQYYFLVDTGKYRLTALPPNAYWVACNDTLVTVNTVFDTTQLDFPAYITVYCSSLKTDIGTPLLRRCFNNTYTVNYCNSGPAPADDAFVRVKLDPFMNFVSASLPHEKEANGFWRFDLGDIAANDCGSFTIVVYLNCSTTVMGQTHCVEAHIYPDSSCIASPNWSGAFVDVDGICQSNSVRFDLRNTGKVATSPLQYKILRDNVVVQQHPFQLPAGGSLPIFIPADGSTWRLEAEQEPGIAVGPKPAATVEACGKNQQGGFSTGFLSQLAEADGSPTVSIDCLQSRGSYDPNDKQGFPLGYGPDHLIEPGQPLDYFIRFQNTGTDTAFTVVVTDTLDAGLDPASIEPGASSHAYQFALSGAGVLTFRFDNILLPDSNVNEAASHGFIKFRIRQRGSIPTGTIIRNHAAIYFDFNAPVLTNETQHRVEQDFIPVETASSDYYIKFPDDLFINGCATPPVYNEPELFNPQGATVDISYSDEIYPIILTDACYKIDRYWEIKSSGYDPALPCITVPNPTPNALANSPENYLGPIVSPAGTPFPWEPSHVKAIPSATTPLDFSTYWSATANCYHYRQVIKILDTSSPEITCPASPPVFSDSTENDPLLWNETYWQNPVTNGHNLSEVAVDLNITADDACSDTSLWVHYLLYLDLDANGSFETVIKSENPPAAGQVNFNNAQSLNFQGGTPQDFDQRPVEAAQKYRFGLQRTVVNGQIVATLGWHTDQTPNVWVQPQLPPGQHQIKWYAEDGCGNEALCSTLFHITAFESNLHHTVTGRVFWDKNENCQADSGEGTPNQWQQVALHQYDPGGQVISIQQTSIAPDGTYQFQVQQGAYAIGPVLPNSNQWATPCASNTFIVNTLGDTSIHDFAVRPSRYCPVLLADIGSAGLQPCADNTYRLDYRNDGTMTAAQAFVRVRLDRFLTFISATLPAVYEGNRFWRFELGDLPALESGSMLLTTYLDCGSIQPAQTFCVEAHIYPDSTCTQPSGIPFFNEYGTPELEGVCAGDSVRFTVYNRHLTEASKLKYLLIRDDKVQTAAAFNLPPGDSLHLSVAADGSTWRLQLDPTKTLPLSQNPVIQSATVEACGRNSTGGISTGFVSQFPEDDQGRGQSMDCQQTSDLYLPNSKLGYPLGYGSERFILQGQPIDYIIRFQNLGSDTVRRVVVLDTLTNWLNPSTVLPGTASHPYRYELLEPGVLRFVFDNIQLPGKADHAVASHGFVKFRAFQQDVPGQSEGAPLGSVITNRATILFDEAPLVATDLTLHRIGQNFVPTSTHEGGWKPLVDLQVWPNPVSNGAVLHVEHVSLQNGRFELYDGRGRFVLSRPVSSNRVDLGASALPTGMYFFKVLEGPKMLGAGKVVVR